MIDFFDEMFKSAQSPFAPQLTPLQMMEMGVFGRSYFTEATEEDFEGLAPAVEELARKQVGKYSPKLNRFKVRSGDSKQAWVAQGWLKPEDPLGWFHWYCRYHNGRRHMRDEWQIERWRNFGIRWGKFGRDQVRTRGWCSPVVKQSLLHWAYEPETILRTGNGPS